MEFNLNKFKERALTIDSIGLLYILLVGGLCHILPIPEIVKGFLALPGFLIIPTLLGILLKNISIFRGFFNMLDRISYFVFLWLFGITLILLIAALLYFLKVFNFVIFLAIILALGAVSVLLSNRITGNRITGNSLKIFKNISDNRLLLVPIILFALTPAVFVQNYTIFPNSINVTNYIHLLDVLRIVEDNTISWINPYAPTAYILFAIMTGIFNTHPFSLMWWITYMLYFLFLCGTALFLYTVSKRKSVTLIGTFIGGAILQGGFVGHLYDPTPPGFLSTVLLPYIFYIFHKNSEVFNTQSTKTYAIFFTTLFLSLIYFVVLTILPIEDSGKIILLLGILIILALYIFIIPVFLNNNDRFIFFIVSLSLLYGTFTYTVHLPIYSLILFFYLLFFTLIQKRFNKRVMHVLFLCVIVFVIFFVVLQEYDQLNFEELTLPIKLLSTLEGSMWDMNFAEKYHNITSSMSTNIFLMILLGGLFVFLFLHKKDTTKIMPVMLTYIGIFFYFLPFFITYRILFFMLPFFVYVIAYFVVSICVTATKGRLYIYLFIIVVFVVCLSTLSIQSFSNYALGGAASKNTTLSVGTYEEYQTCVWIRENTPKKTLIISDPATMGIVPGCSNRKISNDPAITKGGRYPSVLLNAPIEPPLQQYIEDLRGIFMENYTANVYRDIKEISEFDNVLVVISKRTLFWIENNYSDYKCERSCMLYPYSRTNKNISDFPHFKKFFNSDYFELVFEVPNKIYIFKFKNSHEQNESTTY